MAEKIIYIQRIAKQVYTQKINLLENLTKNEFKNLKNIWNENDTTINQRT